MLISGLILVIPTITAKDAEPVNPVRDHRDKSTRPFASDNRLLSPSIRRPSSAFEYRDLPRGEGGKVLGIWFFFFFARYLRNYRRLLWNRFLYRFFASDCEISRINPRARLAYLVGAKFPRWIESNGDGERASERAGGCTLSILAYQTSCFCFRGDNSPTRCLGLARLKSPTWKVHQHNLRKLPDSGMPERISGKVVRTLAKATLRTRVIHSYRSRMLEVDKV